MIDKKNSTISVIGRLGYLSRGVIYLSMSILTLMTFFVRTGSLGEKTNSKGAIQALLDLDYSTPLLYALAVGLICYAIWRLSQSLLDADNHGTSSKGVIIRTGLLISSISHSALSFYTYKLIQSQDSQGGAGNSKKKYASDILNFPYGEYILGAIGLIIIGFGIAQFFKAYKEKYEKYITMKANKKFVHTIAKLALISRGVVFCIIGGLVIYAASMSNSDHVGGMDKMWRFTEELPMGGVLTFTISIGLLCFSMYSILEAFYRRIDLK